MSDNDDDQRTGTDSGHDGGTRKPGGLGPDGTIPPSDDGVAAVHTGVASTFEPEEDEAAPGDEQAGADGQG
ncbi:hypothetical protein N3K63_09465 [Microbacterium sp. W1N]|uniref:hypothetical protein n=1 Tax=Microbacterium festucae TaxID=2977531 RepID=UPI0021BE7FA4|nr:hypothetical protein [Microbacterium festucae]MCT9820508.1 hypothetical protein [Microbacterium festucae]